MTDLWLPMFVCPCCSSPLADAGSRERTCMGCRRTFVCRNGIFRFLVQERLASIEPFLRQYRSVREQDGYRSATAEYYCSLPVVRPDHHQAAAWSVRQQTYGTLTRRVLRRFGDRPLAILDLGAGNGWLSHRLAQLGHRAVAVDWLDDEEDGLGAHKHYASSFVCVQADFDWLPFAARQFDLAIFNGSLHYSPDIAATLGGAVRMLAPGGALLVMDSPLFRRDEDGRAMLARKEDAFRSDYGLITVVRSGVGYLTFTRLAAAAEGLGLACRFFASRGQLLWMVRRMLAGFKIRRPPAGFGLWVAQ